MSWSRKTRGSGPLGGLVLVFALGAGSSACYTYRPVSAVELGDRARVRLTVEEAVRQSESTGEPVREVEGVVTESTPERVSFEVVTARGQSAVETFQFTTSYQVPRTGIEELTLRELSGLRTAGLAALLGGVIYLILDSTVIGGGGDGDPGGGIDPTDVMVRFRIGR